MITLGAISHCLDVKLRFRRKAPGLQHMGEVARPTVRLRRIFDETHDLVWRLLARLGVPDCLLEDGLQLVFLVTAERLDDIAPKSERLFVCSLALRFSRALTRQWSVEAVGDDLHPTRAIPSSTDTALDEKRLTRTCDELLSRMPRDLREPFVLHHIEAFGAGEVAKLLGIRETTVSSRLHQAREQFRFRVEALGEPTRLTEVPGG